MLDTWRRLHGHRRAVSLTTIFDEHYPTLRDTASRADERMVLDTTDSNGLVRDQFVRINSAPQAVQRITCTPTALTYRTLTPLLAMPKLCSRLQKSG